MTKKLFIMVEVDYADDRDIARLTRYGRDSRACRDLLVQMWCYCKQWLTDGHIPADVVGKLAYPDSPRIGLRDADRLVEVGIAERTDTGYFLPGYIKRNKTKAQVEAERLEKVEAGRKGGIASGVARANASTGEAECLDDASPTLKQNEARVQSTEDRVHSSSSNSSIGAGPEPAREDSKPPRQRICTKHETPYHDENCGPCKQDRIALEALTAEPTVDEVERRREVKAMESCTECDDAGWLLAVDDKAIRCTAHTRKATA